ncbi:MAG: DUF1559 domain-containing protein [Pirellulales bacterium]|nr:DUF1559 domain-containing protein [Pirellulales bacterium]
MSSMKMRRVGFTLVELLVVIAIIGILVALLLPAVQAAREAARRSQCKNNIKNIALAIHNFENSYNFFPTGGTYPWPNIEDYVTGGKANGPEQQGLSWAFQILPYLEEDAVHGITTQTQLEQTPVGLYFCPSRRTPTQHYVEMTWLIDYASATPGKSVPLGSGYLNETDFWGNGTIWEVPSNQEYFGIIVRTDWDIIRSNPPGPRGNTKPTTFGKITDGASNTLMLGEKRLFTSCYTIGEWFDDRGWSDGWDPDTVRSTAFPVRQDVYDRNSDQELVATGDPLRRYGFCFGSAHTGGINAAFGDGSVQVINYDIDQNIFNSLGHRSDGNVVNKDDL